MKNKPRKSGWLGKAALGAGVGLTAFANSLYAEKPQKRDLKHFPGKSLAGKAVPYELGFAVAGEKTPSPATSSVLPAQAVEPLPGPGLPTDAPPLDFSVIATPVIRVDPVSVIPNFFGGFVARGSRACFDNVTTQTLTFSGTGAEGAGFFLGNPYIEPPVTVSGHGQTYGLTNEIPYTRVGSAVTLNENGELTPQVQAVFPGASFLSGGGTYFQGEGIDFFYDYLFNSGLNVCVNLPNPAGGGLVGRNRYFENGKVLPDDRVYFFYNHVGRFQGLGTPFDVNRYVFGAEKTFLGGFASLEVRIPFAGTASSDQIGGQSLAVNQTEFGNVGLALKALLYRSPTLAISAGLGVSLPTADDSRLIIGNTPVVVIENRTCILQPMVGIAWAPTNRLYTQLGAQFDFDPSGNPVLALDSNSNLGRIGILTDQSYAFVNYSLGYWLFQNIMTGGGLALQTELQYDSSMGTRDAVQTGTVTVADLTSNLSFFSGTTGLIYRMNRAVFSAGVSYPLGGTRLYDWNLIAQVNMYFGGRR